VSHRVFAEKALINSKEEKKQQQDSDRYTIFHALFEAMKEKDKKHKRR
jgi:hypothetical protein